MSGALNNWWCCFISYTHEYLGIKCCVLFILLQIKHDDDDDDDDDDTDYNDNACCSRW